MLYLAYIHTYILTYVHMQSYNSIWIRYTNTKYKIQYCYFTCSTILHRLHYVQLIIRLQIILSTFPKCWKWLLASSCLSVCPSIHRDQLSSHFAGWTNFQIKFVQKIKYLMSNTSFLQILPFTRIIQQVASDTGHKIFLIIWH